MLGIMIKLKKYVTINERGLVGKVIDTTSNNLEYPFD